MAEPSWQDLYDVGKVTLQTRRPTLVVQEGDVTDAVLAAGASMASAIIAQDAQKFRTTFLDGAFGDDLTARCHDRGVDRIEGVEAIGSVTLSRVSFAAGSGTYVAGSRIATQADDNGKFVVVTTDVDVVFGATDLTKTVTVTCTEIGVAGNVAAGTLDRFLDAPFDPSIVVTNASTLAGGSEEESDEDLVDRTRGFFLTQARGTIDALIYGAKNTSGAGVKRVAIVVDDAGVVTVYVADADGNSNDAMIDLVTAELEHWRDAADVIYVTGGVIVTQDVAVSLTVRVGTNVAALVDKIRAAITSAMIRLNPGDVLYVDAIQSAAKAVDKEAIVSVAVTSPTANIAPAQNELIRAGTISVTG